ncbi:MAG TPA: enoyl-CoA hydratase-related protein [Gammaproteobacteria bacterium]|jgi:methylglutaconyl-CoA hydratase|nr:enoyl-CoA hydratase-related protein [Gammaproteobacteria bacterium]
MHGVVTLLLNRPEKRNALNKLLIQTLLHSLQEQLANPACRVLVIQAEGTHFCAGADIAWLRQLSDGADDDGYEETQLLADLLYQLYHFPKPTLALVQGAALGGGLGLIAACDMALATEDASFGFSEVMIGLAPSMISPYVLAAIGERAARYYFLTGERFSATEAQRLGLVHQLVAPDALQNSGMQLVKRLLQNSPQALIATKQLIRHVAREKITENLAQQTAEHLTTLASSTEGREGLSAFLEKRTPNWE